jgi:DNA-binding transcriptional ArsR family regulator
MDEVVSITKALSDENRLRILYALCGRSLSVQEIIDLIGLAPSTISKHMAILRDAHLVESRRAGRWLQYSLPRDSRRRVVVEAIAWIESCLDEHPQARADRRRLEHIRQEQAIGS